MECNILLTGVGGQGILTIAQAISQSALHCGYNVKQSEVHGMSQRGGAVQAHLRFSDRPVHSDLIPRGRADMLLSLEPLETLRYTEYLGDKCIIVSNSVPFVNIPNYPPVEDLLERIAGLGDHVLLDAQGLARAAGSARAENMVLLGAASTFLDFDPRAFEERITEMFAAKGERVVKTNHQAFHYGRKAAWLFHDALQHGGASRAVRQWVGSVAPEQLDTVTAPDPAACGLGDGACTLSSAETGAIAQILALARRDGRRQLYEHEVYTIVELGGAIYPPRYRCLRTGESVSDADLSAFEGERVVLKLVSPDVVHKTEAGAVAFLPKKADIVNRRTGQLIEQHRAEGKRVDGVLLVEFIEPAASGFGGELFVGIRQTREFGPVIAAGLGGIDTEYLHAAMLPGAAAAKAAALSTTPEQFFETFRKTAAYQVLAGQARGHTRVVSDGELIRCFRAFLAIARAFCLSGEDGPCLAELEVNPFAFAHRRLVPLDGRGRLGTPIQVPPARPIDKIERLLEPKSIAVLGVSSKRENFGRIILNNIKACGFPSEHLYVVKEGADAVDGIRCVSGLDALPEPVDLLVAAVSAGQIPALADRIVSADWHDQCPCSSVILIPGGLGERQGTEQVQQFLRGAINVGRMQADGGPIFLGGNCMGVRSRPGNYDTFFIPEDKLDPRRSAPAKRAALISQSGAFIITRMSNLQCLDPALCISVGNQIDLTVSDVLRAVARRDDIDAIGVYVEGFNDLDGLAFIRAVERAAEAGKVVVFYKAGRTSAGRSAAMGHTASVAGDYDVCQAAVAAAGAVVTDTFKEFEQLMELATDLHGKTVRGRRLAAMSNAGFESVGMADTVKGIRYKVEMPQLTPETMHRLNDVLAAHRLEDLTSARNPLDLTPMADDAAYEECIRVFLGADEVDALIVGCVPMTPTLLTTPTEIDRPGSLARRLPRIFAESSKPLVFVVDCAQPYDELAAAVRSAGVPVFRSADQAVRSLGRYLCHRGSEPEPAKSPDAALRSSDSAMMV